jgi:hypothetical protein
MRSTLHRADRGLFRTLMRIELFMEKTDAQCESITVIRSTADDNRNPISYVTTGISRAERGCGVDPDGISHPTRRFRIELMRHQQLAAAASRLFAQRHVMAKRECGSMKSTFESPSGTRPQKSLTTISPRAATDLSLILHHFFPLLCLRCLLCEFPSPSFQIPDSAC